MGAPPRQGKRWRSRSHSDDYLCAPAATGWDYGPAMKMP